MKVETPAEQLLYSTVRIETESHVGTGFLVLHKWPKDKRGIFLVTNKHVVRQADSASIFFTAEESGQPRVGDRVGITWEGFGDVWTPHPDKQVDLTIAPIADLLQKLEEQKRVPFIRPLPTTAIPTPQQIAELDALEEVLFVGYPSGIYDETNLLPIFRRGITATPLSVDYRGTPRFLIDASVFPGSSGSPVVILNQGTYVQRKEGIALGVRFFLLGVLAEVLTRTESGRLEFIDAPTALEPVVRTMQLLDLGVVVKAASIIETIELLLREHGDST